MTLQDKVDSVASVIRRFPRTIEEISREAEHHKNVAKALEELATMMMRANVKDLNELQQ